MIVNYGGLKMKLVRIINFERQPVMSDDGSSYLFTKFTLNAVGVVNSQNDRLGDGKTGLGMSYVKGEAGKPFQVRPAVEPETSPVITDRTIRHWMSVPRRTLIVSDGTNELIRSPKGANLTCDAKSGPFVETFSIVESMGNARSFIVHFQVTTYLNECEESEGRYAALVGNRYSQHHELDTNYGLTIVTTGTAYFRTDLIQSFQRLPDVLRPYLLLPIPVGFKREQIQITGSSDGGRLDYSFVDVEKSDQFVAWQDDNGEHIGATNIEVNYKEALLSSNEPLQTMADAVNSYYDLKWKINSDKHVNTTKEGSPKIKPTPTPKPKKKKP